MPNFKLAFFDIDGTLVGPDGHYSAAVKSAIQRAQSHGLRTAIASGRPPFACRTLFDDLRLDQVGMFHAGAAIYQPQNQRYLRAQTLEPSSLRSFVQAAQEAGLYCELYLEQGYVVEKPGEIQIAHSHCLGVQPRFAPLLSAIEHGPVFKFLVGEARAVAAQSSRGFTASEPDNTQESDGCYPGLASLEAAFPDFQFAFAKMASHPHWSFASVIHRGVDKSAAFDWLCGYHEARPEEVIAFGDAAADVCFLQRAGLGVAMGNAAEAVKAEADYVTERVEADGVAKALERFVLND